MLFTQMLFLQIVILVRCAYYLLFIERYMALYRLGGLWQIVEEETESICLVATYQANVVLLAHDHALEWTRARAST